MMNPAMILIPAATTNMYAPNPKPQLTVVGPKKGNCWLLIPETGLAAIVLTRELNWDGSVWPRTSEDAKGMKVGS